MSATILEKCARCACRPGLTCQFHHRAPRPCPECRKGTLSYYRDADGGQLVEFALVDASGFTERGYAHVRTGRGGPMRACDRCEHCEGA